MIPINEQDERDFEKRLKWGCIAIVIIAIAAVIASWCR